MHELKNVSLYITFFGDQLTLALLDVERREILCSWSISLSSVVPELPKCVEQELLNKQLSFRNLSSIYLCQKPSKWNSNRLVVTFVRAAGFALPIDLFNLNLGKDFLEDIEILSNRDKFFEFLNQFKKVDWRELKTLYNSCSITNM